MKLCSAKILAGGLALLMTASLAAGCSSSSRQSAAMTASYAPAAPAAADNAAIRGETNAMPQYETEDGYDYAEDAVDIPEEDWDVPAPAEEYEQNIETGGGGLTGGGITVRNTGDENRKIVITVDLSLQTLEFESGTRDIVAATEAIGGYVQDSYVEGINLYDKYLSRSANYTVRVPVDRLNEYLETLSGKFNVLHQQQSSQDISTNYYDTQARLQSLRTQQERLMEMLKTATELKYMLQVEQELANVLYEIEMMTSSLNRMDDSVNMSTVTIRLQEVVKYEDVQPTPATFGERVNYTLGDSWKSFQEFCINFVLFLIALIPFLPVIAVAVLLLFLLLRFIRKRRKAGNLRKQQMFTPVYQVPQQPPSTPEPPAPSEPESGKPEDEK